jgi:hypothetical protein
MEKAIESTYPIPSIDGNDLLKRITLEPIET